MLKIVELSNSSNPEGEMVSSLRPPAFLFMIIFLPPTPEAVGKTILIDEDEQSANTTSSKGSKYVEDVIVL